MAINPVDAPPERSMASLVGGIVTDAQHLIRQEITLARREIAQELNKAKEAVIALGIGIGTTALAGLMLVFGLVYLLHWATSESLPLWGCFGIVGGALVVVGGGLFFFCTRKVGDMHMPEQSIAAMKDNFQWFKKQI